MADLLTEYWYLFYQHKEKPKTEEIQRRAKSFQGVSRLVVPKFKEFNKKKLIIPKFSNDE